MTSSPAAPSKMTSPRSFAYSRSAIRVAVFGLDSAISRGIPIALIFWTTSMKRVTTAGASPSNGSSRSRPSGARAIARATAAIFFQQEPRPEGGRDGHVEDFLGRLVGRRHVTPSRNSSHADPRRGRGQCHSRRSSTPCPGADPFKLNQLNDELEARRFGEGTHAGSAQ
jgi:hypothetical protein